MRRSVTTALAVGGVWICTVALLFLWYEWSIVQSVLEGSLSMGAGIALIPALVESFVHQAGAVLVSHLVVVTLLFALYVTLLVGLFLTFRYISVSSLAAGMLSMIGMSVGITCVSCGALGFLVLTSLAGVGLSAGLFLQENYVFFWLAELVLLGSIYMVWSVRRRLRR